MDKIEMLSRMWIECDPNRQPAQPDQLICMVDQYGGSAQVPRWRWFTARAEESLQFFEKHGYELRVLATEGDRHTTMLGAVGGAQIGGEAANLTMGEQDALETVAARNQMTTRGLKRQRDLQLLAEAYQIATERGQLVLASNIAHLFGELHLDTAA